MQSTNWKNIAELGGIAAILLGLFFVYLEIQQNGTIARADLMSGTTENLVGIHQQLSDPEFARLYAKSLHTPAELTEPERIQLDGFFSQVRFTFTRERRLYNIGVFAEYDVVPRLYGPRFFSSGYGRVWWDIRKKTTDPAVVMVIDEELSKLDGSSVYLEFDGQITQQLGDL